MNKCILIVANLVIFSSFLSATYANGRYNDFTISELRYSRGAGGVHIYFSGGTGDPNRDDCSYSNGFIVPYTSANPEREKAMLSGVSIAYAASKKVSVLLSGCQTGIGGGGNTYPVVWYLFTK